MLHKTAVVGPLQCNCVLLACEKTKEGILIDPGDEPQKILAMVEAAGIKVKYLLHTHAHFDHIGATGSLRETLGAAPCLHAHDQQIWDNLPLQGRMFGMQFGNAPTVEKFLEDEEELVFGEERLKVIHTPGHSPGSVCFQQVGGNEEVFSGDTLFRQSVGRADLWGGDGNLLVRSIKNRLLTLNDDTKVHPGHGPSTSIGLERRQNPFLI